MGSKTTEYYLVTTANENSWDRSKKILFLGKWCCVYSKKKDLATLDYSVASPFSSTSDERKESIDFVVGKTKEFLNFATEALNEYHGTSHSSRYWDIVLGHWLRRYVSIIYNRYFTLQKALQNYEVTETATVCYKNYALVTGSSSNFISKASEDEWNMILFDELLKITNSHSLSKSRTINVLIGDEAVAVRKNRGAKLLVKTFLSSVMKHFTRNSDSLILSSYMGAVREALLKLSLIEAPLGHWDVGQLPQIDFSSIKIDENFRNEITRNFDPSSDFDEVLKYMFMKLLPVCFLEGRAEFIRGVEHSGWPKHPKFIYTSNEFDTNELFKLYAAHHSEKGRAYFVGQHGNSYGTHHDGLNWPETDSSDKFFTWGWSEGNAIPAFSFSKHILEKKIKPKKDGILLLVENAVPQRLEPYDTTYEYGEYQSEQFRFIRSLKSNIHESILVRLLRHYVNRNWHEDLRWRDEASHIQLDNGVAPFMTLVKKSRLAVFSFDTTGTLELMALNFPLICFWRGGTSHVNDSAKPYYDLLMEVGILHDSPESAANKVNEVWDDIDKWWLRKDVQDARVRFCDRYARQSEHPVKELRKLLSNTATTPTSKEADSSSKCNS